RRRRSRNWLADLKEAAVEVFKQAKLHQLCLHILPSASGEAVNIDAVTLATIVLHLERRLVVLVAGAAAKALPLPPPPAPQGISDGPGVHQPLDFCNSIAMDLSSCSKALLLM